MRNTETRGDTRHTPVIGRNGPEIKQTALWACPRSLTIKDQHGRALRSTSRWFPNAGETLTRLPPLTVRVGGPSTRFTKLVSNGGTYGPICPIRSCETFGGNSRKTNPGERPTELIVYQVSPSPCTVTGRIKKLTKELGMRDPSENVRKVGRKNHSTQDSRVVPHRGTN